MLSHVVKDLFDTWCVVQAWGSLDSRHGRMTSVPVAALAEGVREVAAIAKRRQARRYRRVDGEERGLTTRG